MAQLTGPAQAYNADSETVDSSREYPLGTIGYDNSGNEYIYLKGNSNVSANDAVKYDETHQASQLSQTDVGAVAVAPGSAVDSNSFGWFMIRGEDTVNSDSSVSDNSQLYIDGTDGRLDDATSSGDLLPGAIARSTDSSNEITVQLNYPNATNNLG